VNSLIADTKNQYQNLRLYQGADALKCDATYSAYQGGDAQFKEAWVRYHNILLSDEKYRKRKPPVGSRATYEEYGVPPIFSPELGRFLPPMAIGAMSTYLRYIEKIRVPDRLNAKMQNNRLEYDVLLAAAYNAGDGVIATMPAGTNPKNAERLFLENVRSSYKRIFSARDRKTPGYADRMAANKVREVQNHMAKIKDCMKNAGDYR
jgi:hypothetical protein